MRKIKAYISGALTNVDNSSTVKIFKDYEDALKQLRKVLTKWQQISLTNGKNYVQSADAYSEDNSAVVNL